MAANGNVQTLLDMKAKLSPAEQEGFMKLVEEIPLTQAEHRGDVYDAVIADIKKKTSGAELSPEFEEARKALGRLSDSDYAAFVATVKNTASNLHEVPPGSEALGKIELEKVDVREIINDLSLKDRQKLANALALEPTVKTMQPAELSELIVGATAGADKPELVSNIIEHYSKLPQEARKAITTHLDEIGLHEVNSGNGEQLREGTAVPPPVEPPPLPPAKFPEASAAERKLLDDVGAEGVKKAHAFMENGGNWKKFVGEKRIKAPAIPLVLTVATLALPNQKVSKDDGTEEEKWGTGKKIAFGAGSVATLATVGAGHKWGGYIKIAEAAEKVARQEAAKII